MTTDIHSLPEDVQAKLRMLDEFLAIEQAKFPRGKVSADDEGEVTMAIAVDHKEGIIRLQFAKPIRWLGLPLMEARAFRVLLDAKIKELGHGPTIKPQ